LNKEEDEYLATKEDEKTYPQPYRSSDSLVVSRRRYSAKDEEGEIIHPQSYRTAESPLMSGWCCSDGYEADRDTQPNILLMHTRQQIFTPKSTLRVQWRTWMCSHQRGYTQSQRSVRQPQHWNNYRTWITSTVYVCSMQALVDYTRNLTNDIGSNRALQLLCGAVSLTTNDRA
jgi:hypothetical protein